MREKRGAHACSAGPGGLLYVVGGYDVNHPNNAFMATGGPRGVAGCVGGATPEYGGWRWVCGVVWCGGWVGSVCREGATKRWWQQQCLGALVAAGASCCRSPSAAPHAGPSLLLLRSGGV